MRKETNLLKKYNMTVTPQRVEIVSLLKKHAHMSIDDLYSNMINKFPSLSLATVYKNINKMLEKGFILEVKLNSRKDLYELMKDEHSHAVCMKCGSVSDVVSVNSDIAMNDGFSIKNHSTIFYGACGGCEDD